MTFTKQEERAYALAEAAATGVVPDGCPPPCENCKGAGLVPSGEVFVERRRGRIWRASKLAPIHFGVVFCAECNGDGVTGGVSAATVRV